MNKLLKFVIMLALMVWSGWFLITLQKPTIVISLFEGGLEKFAVVMSYIVMIGILFFSIRWFAIRSKNWENSYDPSISGLNEAFRYRNSKFNSMSNEDALRLMRDTQALDAAVKGTSYSETNNIYRYMGSRLNGMSNEDGLEFLKSE